MYNNMNNIYICPYYSEDGCTKKKIYSSSLGFRIKDKIVDICKDVNSNSLKFSVKDTRMNLYIDWTNPITKENVLTRLRVTNGNILYKR